jgi:polysaccharide export outer membrane protein
MDAPNEANKIAHPDYTIAPPDILLIDAANLMPRPPYRIQPLDGLLIRVFNPKEGMKPNELEEGKPIDGLYRVEVDGSVNLGFDYGLVLLAGKTIPEARTTLIDFLKQRYKLKFDINVALVESRALQQIRGEHLVRQDGKVTLGVYGSVFVAGMTLEEAKRAIEAHLSLTLFEPEISLDVTGFNSKVYYVIVDLGSAGQLVNRVPVTGNETVLDAISQIKGLPGGSDSKRIFVSRQSPLDHAYCQVLPEDWHAICHGSPATNYEILPGDRVFVGIDRFVEVDQWLAKIISPVERVLGVTLLGSSTLHSVAIPLNSSNGTTGTVP